MNTFNELAEAFTIFGKYTGGEGRCDTCACHDEFHCQITHAESQQRDEWRLWSQQLLISTTPSEEDQARLEELGWEVHEEHDCGDKLFWFKFT